MATMLTDSAGAMYTLSPDEINGNLGESVAKREGSQELNLVLLKDVPDNLRDDMQLLGQI